MNLVNDLLTENRYWTFWSENWQTRVNVLWNGQTPWEIVKNEMKIKYFRQVNFGYERQVQLKNPDITFK
jgi:hypothetical protein